MKIKNFILLWCLCTALGGYSQSQCFFAFPPSPINLCVQGQPNISNTPTSITIPNPTSVPVSGAYTISFNYFSRSTGRCTGVITCPSSSIAVSGSGFVINLGGCANLPANFHLSPYMQINMVSNTGGQNYFFLYANRDCGIPLPIEISSFEVESIVNGEVNLVWTTTSEVDASHFIIERTSSADAPDPDMSLGRVNAIYPNSGGTYRFTDRYAANGYNAYRLRMVDLDGSFTVSKFVYTVCNNCTNTPPPVDCSHLGIAGPDVICSGQRFVGISGGMPDYTAATWAISSSAGTLSSNFGQAIGITQVGNEVVTVNATVSGCTPQTMNKSKTIKLGKVVSGGIDGIFGGSPYELYHDGTEHLLPRGYWLVTLNDPNPAVSTPTWTLLQGNLASWQWNASTNQLEFWFPFMGGGYGIFQMSVNTDCGPVTNTYTFIEYNVRPRPIFVLSPNPASSMLNLSVDHRYLQQQKITPSSEHTIQQIMVHDRNGTLVLQQKYPVNSRSVSLNIAALKADVYTVRVFNGKEWQSLKFIKQ